MEKGASITMNLATYMGLEFSIDSTFSRLGIGVCGVFFFFFLLYSDIPTSEGKDQLS